MSVSEILREISALPTEERLHLVEKLVQLSEADIPQSLRESMAEADRGELIDLDDALTELDRPLSTAFGPPRHFAVRWPS